MRSGKPLQEASSQGGSSTERVRLGRTMDKEIFGTFCVDLADWNAVPGQAKRSDHETSPRTVVLVLGATRRFRFRTPGHSGLRRKDVSPRARVDL